MSWVFALLLSIYATVWAAMWVRGRMAWWRAPIRTEAAPVPRDCPRQLNQEHRALFIAAQACRVQAWTHARTCTRVLLTDPDVRLAGVRSGCFRRASHEGARQVRSFHQLLCESQEHNPAVFAGLPDVIAGFDAAANTLEDQARVIARARALEAFPVRFCEAGRESFLLAQRLSEELCDLLEDRSQAHPYRPGARRVVRAN